MILLIHNLYIHFLASLKSSQILQLSENSQRAESYSSRSIAGLYIAGDFQRFPASNTRPSNRSALAAIPARSPSQRSPRGASEARRNPAETLDVRANPTHAGRNPSKSDNGRGVHQPGCVLVSAVPPPRRSPR